MVVLFKIKWTLHFSMEFFVVNILVKNRPCYDWQSSESHVVKCDVKIVEKSLTTPSILKTKVKLRQSKYDVFVVEIKYHFWVSYIRPSAMNEQQLPQGFEFRQSKIRSLNCSHTFFPIQPNSYVSFLNHVNIISAISNSQCDFVLVFFDKSNNFSFLFRTHSATYYRVALRKYVSYVISG